MSFDCLLKKLHRNCLPFNVHTSSFSVKFLIYDSLILGLWSGFPIATILFFHCIMISFSLILFPLLQEKHIQSNNTINIIRGNTSLLYLKDNFTRHGLSSEFLDTIFSYSFCGNIFLYEKESSGNKVEIISSFVNNIGRMLTPSSICSKTKVL